MDDADHRAVSHGDAAPASPFLALLRAGGRALAAEFERSAPLQHTTSKGSRRELAVRPLARQLFPRRYEITSGEVMNAAGERSRAQDVIVFDPNVVAGWHIDDSDALVPAEAVVANLEVKSGASRADIDAASDNLGSVKAVFGHRARSGLAGDLVIDETVDRPLSVALFYESKSTFGTFVDNVLRSVGRIDPELRTDLYLLLGIGALTWPPDEHGKPLRSRTVSDEMIVFEGADTMLAVAYAVSSHVLTWVPPPLDIWEYARKQPGGFDLRSRRRRLPTEIAEADERSNIEDHGA